MTAALQRSPKEILKKYALSKDEVERQVNEIFYDVDLDKLMFESCVQTFGNQLERGTIVEGKITVLRSDYALIDFGYKSEGFLPYKEDGHVNDDLDLGDVEHFLVSKIDDSGVAHLTRKNVKILVKQKKVLATLEVGAKVEAKLLERNKNGWVVSIDGLPAILPVSKESLLYPQSGAEGLVDTLVEAEIESIDDMFVTVTREAYTDQVRREAKSNFFSSLAVGNIVDGTVKNITKFGVFIQISSGIIGLCHATDKGNEELSLGQKIQSKILKIDKEKNRISLGIRQVTEPTWAELVAKYEVDSKVNAVVKSLVPYGAFMEVESGVNGLIHVSDLSWSDHIKHPKEVLHVGQEVEVVILGIDTEKQHLSLGLKQASPDPWVTITDKYIVGSTVEGCVTNKTKFGIFVELEKGVEGLAHHNIDSKSLKSGDFVQVSVLRVDALRKKISLALE
jgi:small subunit ribosomal protein S1